MNTVILLGRLTADIDLKKSKDTQYAQFSIAVDRARNNGVDFINCVAFNKLAELLANYCQKGRQILVNGRLQVSNNKGRNYYTVISNQITFLQRPRNAQNDGNTSSVDRKVAKASATRGKTVKQGGKPF